jgi:AcrR family transcriptional regulator
VKSKIAMRDHKKNPRYVQLLVTAKDLFWKHGLKRVTVEEICREAGVSKMTFYKFFPNKVVLAKAVYDREVEDGYKKFKTIMEDGDTSPPEKMESILRLKLEGSNDISPEFMQDFYANPELGLLSHVEEKSREIWVEVIKDFKKAQHEGWLRKDFKPEGIFMFMNKFLDIFNDTDITALYGSPQELVMELTRFFIYGIIPREGDRKR